MMARYGRETMWNLLQTKLADNAAKAPDGLEQAQKPWRKVLLLYNELLAENACCSLAELRIGGESGDARTISAKLFLHAFVVLRQRLCLRCITDLYSTSCDLSAQMQTLELEKLANEHGALVRRAERLYRSGWRGETDGRE